MKFYSCQEVANLLSERYKTPNAVAVACLRGTIKAKKFGRSWMIPKSEVERLKAHIRNPHQPPEDK